MRILAAILLCANPTTTIVRRPFRDWLQVEVTAACVGAPWQFATEYFYHPSWHDGFGVLREFATIQNAATTCCENVP